MKALDVQEAAESLHACPAVRTAKLVGDEWILLILRELFKGPKKFDEIQKATLISTNILTNRLKRMLEGALVGKELYQEHPPRYRYRLTKAGLGLMPLLLEMMRYGEQWLHCEHPAPIQLRHLGCGELTKPGQVCSVCGEPLTIKNLRMVSSDQDQALKA